MRVLMSTTSGTGHFRPLLPLALALTRAGHEVACAAPVEAAAMVEREGLLHLPFDGVPPDHPERIEAFAAAPTLPPHEARQLVGAVVFGRLNTTAALPGAQAAVARFAPDLVVHEAAELGVRLAAEAAGVPVVSVAPSLWVRAFPLAMAAGVADLRESLGLDRDEEGRSISDGEGISWFPRSFDLPDAPGQVRRFRDGSLPAPTPVEERSVVYVTLGTEAAALPFFAHVLPPVVRGAVQAGLPVVVATGKPVDPVLLGGIDGDVRVESWVDQAEVLRTARVVVCHAGSGTVLGALASQVPIVAVPLFADQPDNAARIAETGCGLQVPPTAARVEAATRELAARLPEGCVRMGRELAALRPAEDAVPWLEALAAQDRDASDARRQRSPRALRVQPSRGC